MQDKQNFRIEARARRALLAKALPDFAQRIARFAGELSIPEGAVVSGYFPMGEEADPRLLMAALAARGHRLALPRIAARASPLEFYLWKEGDALTAHSFGMSEPLADAPKVVPDIVLVPLLAFDAQGHRLGYGGGFYDRTLALAREEMGWRAASPSGQNIKAIGIAYAGQEVPALPREAHDHRLDMIVTELGVRTFSQ